MERASPGAGGAQLQRDQDSVEAWLDDHRDFTFSYFVRKATRRALVPLGHRDLDSAAVRSPLAPPQSLPGSRASFHSVRLRPGLRGVHGGAGEGDGGGGGQRGAGGSRAARLSPEAGSSRSRAQRRGGGGGGRGGGPRGAPHARGKRSPLRPEGLGLGRRRAAAGRRRPRSPRSSRAGSGAHRLQAAAVGGRRAPGGAGGAAPGSPRRRAGSAVPGAPRQGAAQGGAARAAGSVSQRAGFRGRLTWAPHRPWRPGAQGPAEAEGAAPPTSCVRYVALWRPNKMIRMRLV
ncbi:translation initiation factor IF-2-like [Vulpes lagopus]|uniref:translation initiation factor IF-2-like n=1 Tax=Vulpes lagopus TaxID=494514 RepID=UPI001BC9EEAA|nr:translation initiation factor IF-2-like [Vulpes lagopus]